ncbi:MAG: BamA/TamA family outer membrane protein, partial [Saprospiraceae bacterium]|nr:BamA/TamA family outer membrane protein [Saprospiraceae bacterium]
VFEQNIRGFEPQPVRYKKDTVVFDLPVQASADSLCRRLLQHFRQRSYLQVSLDSFNGGLRFWSGPSMEWLSLRLGSGFEAVQWRNGTGLPKRAVSGKRFQAEELLSWQTRLLEQAENNGYPFARIWLDSVQISDSGLVSAVMQLNPGRYFVFKNIRIQGDAKLPVSFLPNYVGLQAGMPYSRARVLRLRGQLQSLLFVESTANPGITFSNEPNMSHGEATVNVFLKKKRASRFDFIIGLLPQPNNQDGRLLLTGSLSAAFQNALNLGERFSAELERLRPETQKVDVQAGIPYLFGSSFGAEGRLGIFRRDSTWTDAQGDLGVTYWLTGANTFRFFWENRSSSLQVVDTQAVLSTRRLPENLDYRQNGFGLECQFSALDYRFNPRKGWLLSLKAVAGFNTVRPNNQITSLVDPDDPGFSFAGLYDSLSRRAARYRLEWKNEWYVPVLVRSTIKIALRSGAVFSKNTIFNNENFRLGGNKLLRGFDEESLFMTRFVVATAEYRLLLGQNSFLSAFADYGYMENLSGQNKLYLRPLGLGAGLNFETKAGIFGISAAVGRRDAGQSPDLRAMKFHLGYVSLF